MGLLGYLAYNLGFIPGFGSNAVVVNDVESTREDIPKKIDVLANDRIPRSITPRIEVDQPEFGYAVLSGTEINYFPENQSSPYTDSFTYRVFVNGKPYSGRVDLEVEAEDDPPIPNSDQKSTEKNKSVDIDVLSNDEDPDSDNPDLKIGTVTPPERGQAEVSQDDPDMIVYTPPPGYVGQDRFSYTLADSQVEAEVLVNVAVRNEPPVARDDDWTYEFTKGVAILRPLSNDSDDGGMKRIESIRGVRYGKAEIQSQGQSIRFTFPSTYRTQVEFDYVITDGEHTDEGTIIVRLKGISEGGENFVTNLEGNENQPAPAESREPEAEQPPSQSENDRESQAPQLGGGGLTLEKMPRFEISGDRAEVVLPIVEYVRESNDRVVTIRPSSRKIRGRAGEGNLSISQDKKSLTFRPNPGATGEFEIEFIVQDLSANEISGVVYVDVVSNQPPKLDGQPFARIIDDETTVIIQKSDILKYWKDPEGIELKIEEVTGFSLKDCTVEHNDTEIIYHNFDCDNENGDLIKYWVTDGKFSIESAIQLR